MTSSSSSLSYDELINNSDHETCGFEVGCNAKRKRFPFKFLQCFATPKYALGFLCLASLGQGFVTSGLLSVVISTLEKRFHLQSTETGFIASSYDIASFLSVLFITYIGGRGHKPLWIGWGIFLLGLGSLVFTLPHFLAPTYSFGVVEHNVCNATTSNTECTVSGLRYYMSFFIIAQLLHGAGGTTLFSLGVTYLDENVPQAHSSLYHGIYFACSVLGPAFGFLLGGRFLKTYTDITTSVSITEDSSLWIGAWWFGFLIGGIVIIVMSFPILMFPKQLPGTAGLRVNRETEMHQDKMAIQVASDNSFGHRLGDVWRSVVLLMRNPTYLMVSLAISFDAGLVLSLTTFGPKYLESMFGVTPTEAALYFGVLAILAGASGQLIGGVVVTKAKLTVSGMLKFCALSSAVAACTTAIFTKTCSDTKFAGGTVPYPKNMNATLSPYNHTSSCNAGCRCDTDAYDPICGKDGITYYSPCFAGCTSHTNAHGTEVYSNCSCIASNIATAVQGKCNNQTCHSLPLFLAIFFIAIFATFLPGTPAIQAILRVVPFTQRSFAIGIKFVFVRLVGSIPGPIIFGKVLDLACVVWSTECGNRGSCELYKNENLASHMATLIAVLKLLVTFLLVTAWLVYKPPPESALDAVDQVSFTRTIGDNNFGLPTAHGAGGGIGEVVRQRITNTKYDFVSYKTLREEIDTDI
ncbi:solute carrier organic anion transporter family member 4A1-like [Clavelina lepadiformis]|uniref:Solute carrier organic anion transporter family member n=1 Tax=Clavelina lepadiformis TaxID=159417 RepID=A0ABP0FJR5_CLALP